MTYFCKIKQLLGLEIVILEFSILRRAKKTMRSRFSYICLFCSLLFENILIFQCVQEIAC
jgi:hypothetical protein